MLRFRNLPNDPRMKGLSRVAKLKNFIIKDKVTKIIENTKYRHQD